MIIIPAIDIRGGKVVRLTQGEFDKQDTYFDHPMEVAKLWKRQGVTFLHLVDLDGALAGTRVNAQAIAQVASLLPCELGGGIRTMEDIAMALNLGVSKAIIGTAAIADPGFVRRAVENYGERIIVSIDAKNGLVATDGWTKVLDKKAVDFAREMEDAGVQTLIYTDISKDGMMQGPNLEEVGNVNQAVDCDVIASGGVSSTEDVKNLRRLGLHGCIVGKAIYEGKIKIEELI